MEDRLEEPEIEGGDIQEKGTRERGSRGTCKGNYLNRHWRRDVNKRRREGGNSCAGCCGGRASLNTVID